MEDHSVGGLNCAGKAISRLTLPTRRIRRCCELDANLGCYGNPKITKLADGTWVVIVALAITTPTASAGSTFNATPAR